MPNDCWSRVTITCENPDAVNELNNLILNELKHKDGEKYVYNETVDMIKRGPRGIILIFGQHGILIMIGLRVYWKSIQIVGLKMYGAKKVDALEFGLVIIIIMKKLLNTCSGMIFV